jgi:hypothetical protein
VFFVRALEPFLLPPLTFIATKIVNVERPVRLFLVVELALKFDKALARCMNRETTKVCTDPFS